LNTRQHAHLAREQQDACGGVDTCLNILEVTPYKMGRTHMYECREQGSGKTMPIGAIVFLDRHLVGAGQAPVYTPALQSPDLAPTEAQCATSEACEASEVMAIAQRLVRKAGEDNHYSETEKREIEPHLLRVEAHIRGVRAAMDATS
jgi:hypothetical protein